MTSIYNYVIVLTIGGLAFGFNGKAESQEKLQLKSAKNSINAEYRVAKNKCSLLYGSAEDACLAEAKATKTKAINSTELKASKAGETINGKACDTNAEAIDKELLEKDMESAVTEIKPIESNIIPLGKDIFKGRIRIVA
ncbi:MAG: hypothetical protein ABL880_03555 [Methylotenera sp.]